MRKKLFTFLFAVMVCTGTMFAVSGSCGVKLTWNLTDSVLTISGTGQMYTYYEEYGRRAPWHSYSSEIARVIINDGATSIGNCAFQECSTMTSIEIPNSVTSIGKLAFNKCFALTSIDIPLGVKYIGTEAFYYCSNLTTVTLSNNLTSIGDWAFNRCYSITSIDIPNSVTNIGEDAFWGCTSMVSLTIGNSVESIGEGAFEFCDSLTSVTIPNSVKSIGAYAFYGCDNLPVIDNIRYADTYVVEVADKTLSSYTIKEGTKWIGEQAFEECTNLTSITIPSSVKSIGAYAFTKCSNLATIQVKAQTPPFIYSSSFHKINENAIYYVPPFYQNLYKNADVWRDMNLQSKVDDDDIHVSPTACTISFEPSRLIASVAIKDGESFIGNVLEYNGLEPATEYKDIPVILTSHTGETDTVKLSFMTTQLELATKDSKPVSSTTAILLAETNMSDAETNCGFEYKRNDAPEDFTPTKVYCPVSSGTMAGRLKNLKDDVYYKYRAFYQSAAGNTYYGDWKYIFTGDVTLEFDPILYTYAPVVVSENKAILKGYALAGSEDFTEQGFEYWAESRAPKADAPLHMPAELGEHFFVQASGISMSVTLDNLEPGTVYKYRVYAKTGDQVLYGSEQSFTTQGEYIDETTAIEEIQSMDKAVPQAQKVLRNGHLLILSGDKIYTITGQEVK